MAKFTIRVYGIASHNGKILLSKERIKGAYYLKFPGGGLEFGEGTRDALTREFLEEANAEVEVLEHFYTTDFFQPSTFHAEPIQVLSVYYKVRLFYPNQPLISDDKQTFIWIDEGQLTPDRMDLPIDQKVVELWQFRKQAP
ncbi:MAG: NUDIX domain-containing protein [Cryomorphaceae bacterium]|nr:MAG: NUDIX domain-containing protein [Cryomorphaceae bacterium]